MNGGNGSKILKMINGDGGVTVASSIRDTLPTVKIYICTVPSYWEDSYSDNDNGQDSRINQNLSYFNLFEDLANVFIVPLLNYHRKYGYRLNIDKEVQFDEVNAIDGDIAIPTIIQPYDHHPSSSGCKSIAYMIYNYLFQN